MYSEDKLGCLSCSPYLLHGTRGHHLVGMIISATIFFLLTMAALHNGFVFMEAGLPQAREKFTLTSQAESTTIIELIFHVKENNRATLEEILLSISDPTSSHYGKHLTKSEIDDLTSNPEALRAVSDFLKSLEGVAVHDGGHLYHIRASASVATWDAALNAKFHNFERVDEKGTKLHVIRTAEYSLPQSVAPHVESVFNTVQFPIDIHHHVPSIRSHAHVTKLGSES